MTEATFPPCHAGEETRPQTAAEVAEVPERFRQLRRHVLGAYGRNTHYTLCHGVNCGGTPDAKGLDKEEREWLAVQSDAVKYLVAQDVGFIGEDHLGHPWPKGVENPCLGPDGKLLPHGKQLCISTGDTFMYACADGEDVPAEQVDEVLRIYKQWGPTGLVCWAAKQGGMDPVIEYTEDPVYQRTWTALYGDLKLKVNFQLEVTEGVKQFGPTYRWSQRRLNLSEWTPLS